MAPRWPTSSFPGRRRSPSPRGGATPSRPTAGTAASSSLPPDGIDLIPLVSGKTTIERTLFWRILNQTRAHRAVRSGQWKLLMDGQYGRLGTAEVVRIMLFDLKLDPGERHDLAAGQPARVSQLLAAIQKWEADVSPRPRSP